MPNHTSTQLIVSGPSEYVNHFVNRVGTKESRLDFNAILPMPSELVGSRSPSLIQTEEEIAQIWREFHESKGKRQNSGPMGLVSHENEKPWNLGITQAECDRLIKEYGASNWYDWAIKNWGTKWGAYEVSDWDIAGDEEYTEGAVFYQTAWSPATKFFKKASLQFPYLTFYHEFADEGGGFLGYEKIVNGDVIESKDLDWNSDEGIEMRQRLGCYSDNEEADDNMPT